MPSHPSNDIAATLTEHRTKANTFIRKAWRYHRDDQVISRICSFYAAYHAMRFAILSDPIFDLTDEEIYQQTYISGLCKDSKHNGHHSARPDSPRGIGQNQIVTTLYPKWAKDYESLHKTSIDARYVSGREHGEIVLDAHDACCKAQAIVDDALNGNIQWQMKNWKK